MLGWLNNAARGALAITSPEPARGAAGWPQNLAVLFAQAGQRTLLIDADLRQPCQHRLFNLDNSVGLSAVLTGRANGRDVAVPDFIRRWNCWLLPRRALRLPIRRNC